MSIWGRRVLGGQQDSYRLILGHELKHGAPRAPPQYHVHGGSEDGAVYDCVDVVWSEDESEATIVQRVAAAKQQERLFDEHVRVRVHHVAPDIPGSGIVSATSPAGNVAVSLLVRRVPAKLRSVELQRQSNYSGGSDAAALSAVMDQVNLESVQRLKCAEGLTPIWDVASFHRWQSLTALNLGNCGLASLSPMVGGLGGLLELRLSDNRLTALPREIGLLRALRVLVVDNNLLTALPGELKQCAQLRSLSVESNRLATPLLDLRPLVSLRSLQLFGNPLEYLPELSHCTALRHLSLANVRISADQAMVEWNVDVLPATSYLNRAHKLAPLCGLMFRTSAGHHPLLAGALGELMTEESNCQYVAQLPSAIPQLVLMGLSDNELVVEPACKVIGLLGRQDPATADKIMENDVLAAMLRLVHSSRRASQLCGLRTLASLALASDSVAARLLTQPLSDQMQELMRTGNDDVRAAALEVVGNLAFCAANRAALLATNGLLPLLARLAASDESFTKAIVRIAAIRALAVLGENDAVRRAVGRAPIRGRGLRVLTMDGGGMKGIATLRLLRQLEERSGRPIHEMFDIIGGTSTGGILATALGVRKVSLLEAEEIYRVLGAKVFSRPNKAEAEGWRDSLYRVYKSGQQSMRVAVYGCKHDAAMFEVLLRDYCKFPVELGLVGDAFIDTACLDVPKCFVVSSLVSMTPAQPYIFRNYEYPSGSAAVAARIRAAQFGSSKHPVWQAVRASSAAPYYLDDFTCHGERFQDGATTANNPAMLAVQEARRLWPDIPIDCVVSLGTGELPTVPRERSMSAYFDTGSVLIESATDVFRVDAALATLGELIPGLRYFRFTPVDPRCAMELDEIAPSEWAKLETATDEYIATVGDQLDDCVAALTAGLPEPDSGNGAASGAAAAVALRLGLRRRVLVVDAYRSLEADSATHVEAVGRAAAQLPHGAACAFGSDSANVSAADGDAGEGGSSDEGRAAAKALAECAARIAERCAEAGVLHLAMHGSTDGLVSSWRTQVVAVAEPSDEARDLLASALPATEVASLREFCSQHRQFAADGQSYALLSEQTHPLGGGTVSGFLFARTRAASCLTATQARLMSGVWDDRIVTSSSHMPAELTAAILAGGAKAVVCAADDADPPADGAADFFRSLFSLLGNSVSLLQAVQRSEAAAPAVAGMFAAWILLDGQLCDLQQAASVVGAAD